MANLTTSNMLPTVHPEFVSILQLMATARVPKGDIEQRRKVMNAGTLAMKQAALQSNPALESEVERRCHFAKSTIDGHRIPILHYTRKTSDSAPNTSSPAVVNMHAGGLIMGSAESMDAGIRQHVLETGVPFFDIEYRLAPEHPYPTPQEDSWTALVWIHQHGAELGIDTSRIALMGESAGGCLAAGLALRARDQGLSPPPTKLILITPMLDDRTMHTDPSIAPLLSWTADDNETAWNAILRDASVFTDTARQAVAAPGRVTNLSGLPPTLLQIAGLDLFLEEDMAFGLSLGRQGVDVEIVTYAGVPHGFEVIRPGCSVSSRAREDRNRAIRAL